MRMLKLNFLLSFCRVVYNSAVSRELCRLMKLPVDYFNNILTILQLNHYADLMQCFDYTGRKTLALYLVNNILNMHTYIPTQELVRNSQALVFNRFTLIRLQYSYSDDLLQVEQLLGMISSLLEDQTDQPVIDEDPEDFAEEQSLVAKYVIHVPATYANSLHFFFYELLIFILFKDSFICFAQKRQTNST